MVSSTGGSVGSAGTATTGRVAAFSSAAGSFFSGSVGWVITGTSNVVAVDYLAFCAPTSGYTGAVVTFVGASSV